MNKNKVIIVGGGMVGAATAVTLAKQGRDVTVIEKHLIDADHILSSDKVDIRISAINRFSENLLDDLGAMPLLRQNRIAPYQQLEAYQQQDENLLFDCKDIGETHLGHLIENNLIQASLWQQFAKYNIEVIEQTSLITDISQTPDAITLHYGDTKYTADLVVAADGGQSQLRTKAGLGVTGWQYGQHCMGVLIKLDAPQQVKTWQQFTPTGPVAFLPMQAPYANLICYHDAAVLKQWHKLSNEQLKAKLIEHFPELPGDFEVLEHAVFPLARQHANDYSQGRLVLVGDSAHTINPLAGQGVNLGFQDVVALADILAEQQDVGHHDLLKRYEKKRRHANLLMMSMMDACYFGFSNEVKPLSWVRSKFLKLANNTGPAKNWVLKYAISGTLD
ncbi:FAD-dependent oxidoreductase [Pseudoalteromonas shioyasakiensis]|uniref:FAD-dependent oxidoreductase n=1 Tax=Pseudoalteromonas TaxID=53246 RepID=UPI000C8BD25E|nr:MULTISPECIES: FAD-dependent oxidoreductase [Pseudoalteromonas]MAD02120.1 tungsten formylmethanofuran dehydrogenase [Pseudoalteromonas sp.]MCQ8881834.1 FAD-dependent oxidoreductase [Pseudoalteromonas shioyasakiensis]NIZ05859.1 FAD-dependent oxidoreductase [Pseudoalteromonas sp. HF66]QLE09776.1 FAD-dependent oxidoreductase [Pseudoalteromonas shioyasakiensis]QWV06297.1 FAD-dependent oxidoreductase [Pseudoalteromonas shioyasakiensis]|tara:strand:- start:132 stop:1301 length:1170 start_codon:yes stop_codon:yes gene_type:complete